MGFDRLLLRTALLWFAGAALLLGTAIPRGWMPGADSEGGFAIVICSQGLSPQEQALFTRQAHTAMAMAHGGGDEGSSSKHDAPKHDAMAKQCPYGVAAHVAGIDPHGPVFVSPIGPAAPPYHALPAIATGHGLAAPPPPARGPPLKS